MNKDRIVKEINKLRLDKKDFWVIGSSSLVLRGIIEEANDIDLAVTDSGYLDLNDRVDLSYLGEKYNVKWYKVNDIIEFCIDQIDSAKVDICEPFNLLNLEYYYNNFLKNSNREKDADKIRIIKTIID